MASLSNGAIGLDLTWPEEVKRRSSIFQRAATWKRSQIRPWLPLKLNRKSKMPLSWETHREWDTYCCYGNSTSSFDWFCKLAVVLTFYSPAPGATEFSDWATSVCPGHASTGYKLTIQSGLYIKYIRAAFFLTHTMSKWYPVRPLRVWVICPGDSHRWGGKGGDYCQGRG